MQEQFKVQLDVDKTILQLHRPVEVRTSVIIFRTYEVVRLPLLSEPYHEELAKLMDPKKDGGLPEGEILTKSNDVKSRLAAAEDALIESLSRTEWEAFTDPPK